MFQQTLHTLNSIPEAAWNVIIQSVASAVVVSPLFLGVKKWFSIDSPKKMVFLVMLGSMAAAAIAYLVTVPQFAPWFILVTGWLTFATTQPVYHYFAKPFFTWLGAWITGKVNDAKAINEAKSAAVPATGLPITGSTTDFSR